MPRKIRRKTNFAFRGCRRLIPRKYAKKPVGEVTSMKASAFSYARATSVGNALELLAANGDRAKVLSGGQSLMPAMNLRLISPELVVDIGGITQLRDIAVRGEV